MLGFIARRIAFVIPTFLGVTLLAFALIHLIPGDPVLVLMGEQRLTPADHRASMARLGLDQPLAEQYVRYLERAVTGELGRSLVTGNAVVTEFFRRFPATLELAFCAAVFGTFFGLLLGVAASLRRGSLLDQGLMAAALTGYSMPIFWWGLLLIMFFSVEMQSIAPSLALPVSGRIASEFDVPRTTGFILLDALMSNEPGAMRSALAHLVLPTIVLGTRPMAVIARMSRSSLLEVLREDYMRAARARGLSPFRVVVVHGLRNALIPVVTVLGLQVGALMGGAVLTETIFSWPGIGKWMIDAVSRRDYPAVQGGILLIASFVIVVNLVVDLLYGLINPRVRHGR